MATTAKSRRRAKKPAKKKMTHAQLVDSICGKYRFVKTSSELFAAQKQREFELDDRAR